MGPLLQAPSGGLQRTAWVVAIAVASGVVAPAGSQSVPARSMLAYTQSYCECTAACNAFCASPNASLITTPSGQSTGPSDHSPSWSPDAARIAFVRAADIVVMDVVSGTLANLTNTESVEYAPAWSPDGRRIAFVGDSDAQPALHLMNADGTGVVPLPAGAGFPSWSRLTFSPDSTRIGFDCEVEAGNEDICDIGADGTGFRRITTDPSRDRNPAWSPDGQHIAFATDRYAPGMDVRLAVMSSDGSNVTQLGGGIPGWSPAWSTDGKLIAFEATSFYAYAADLYLMDADGFGITLIAEGATSPAWPSGSASLIANFSIDCDRLSCDVDASSSTGPITSYAWNFGDGGTASGSTASHTYLEGGSKTIGLTLTGANGSSTTSSRTFALNRPPVAALTASCEGLTCVFDWSGSHDSDGTGLTLWFDWGSDRVYNWFSESPTRARLTYPAPGTYTATIRVGDDAGAISSASQTFTLTASSLHVGDLDLANTPQQNTWSATVEVHDASHRPVSQAVVTVSSSSTKASCTTDATGRCAVARIKISPKGTLKVVSVTHATFIYKPASNHDPDGDSSGTVVGVQNK